MTLSESLSQVSDGLLQACRADPVVDPQCACLLSGGGPEMNVDIVGLGVRIMFYLQSLIFMFLSVRAALHFQVASALYVLIATNIVMVVITFILGFKQDPEISLQDAIVIGYLLLLSWISGSVGLPMYNRFVSGDKVVKIVFAIHSYVLFAYVAALIVKVDTFGRTPLCNAHAVAIIFVPFNAIHAGRIVTSVLLGVVVVLYTCNLFADYAQILCRRWWSFDSQNVRTDDNLRGVSHDAPSNSQKDFSFRADTLNDKEKDREDDRKGRKEEIKPLNLDGPVICGIMISVVLWTLIVVNTELLVKATRFVDVTSAASEFKLEQTLLLPLVVPALKDMLNAYYNYGLRRPAHRRGGRRSATRNTEQPFGDILSLSYAFLQYQNLRSTQDGIVEEDTA